MSCGIFIFYSISFFLLLCLYVSFFIYNVSIESPSYVGTHDVLPLLIINMSSRPYSRDMLHVVFMRTYNRLICFIKGHNVAQQHRSDLFFFFFIFPPPPMCASSPSSPSLLSFFSPSHLSSEPSLRRYSIRQVVNTGEKGVQCHVTVSQSMTEPGTGPSSPGYKYIAIFLFRV